MRRRTLGIGAIILSVMYFAEPATAQDASDLAGSWEFTIEAPQRGGGGRGDRGGGDRGGRGGGRFGGGPQTLVLHVEDGLLVGTLESERGDSELRNIMLEGNKITFTVTRETPRGSFEATYTGEIDGDAMSGSMEGRGGFTINWKATRIET